MFTDEEPRKNDRLPTLSFWTCLVFPLHQA
jgi:hypothetical protein